MYLVSYNKDDLLDTKDLDRPNKSQQALIQDAYNKLPKKYKNIPIEWFVKSSKRKETKYAGMATKLNKEKHRLSSYSSYAICIWSFVFKESYEYIQYVLTHELKHCIPQPLKDGGYSFFRRHDVELYGLDSSDKYALFGFFNDEWGNISCCDKLMYYFNHCLGIEEFLG